MELLFLYLVLLATQTASQAILSVLATHQELSTLNTHLNASETLSFLLSTADNFTFIAPSNTAFDRLSQNSGDLTEDEIETTLLYHFLKGGFPTLGFSQQPQFAVTHLINTNEANVTGGQVVEVVSDVLGIPQFLSGNKSVTTISQADILCTGGIIHIVDEVLTLPPEVPVLIQQANLKFFISLLQTGGFLTTTSSDLANEVRLEADVTTFCPNTAEALDAFNAVQANSTKNQLAAAFKYHVIQDFVGYSTDLKNGMQLQTLNGKNLTVRKRGNDTFVNGARIITSDYLTSNGVIHVIDKLLDPNNITGPPTLPTLPEKKEDKSTSKVAIGLGVTFPLLFCAGVGYFLLWFLKRRKLSTVQRKPSSNAYTRQIENKSGTVSGQSGGRKANMILGQDLELDISPIERRYNTPQELNKSYELYSAASVPKSHEFAVELDATPIQR